MFSSSFLKNLTTKLTLATLILSFSVLSTPIASADEPFDGKTYVVDTSEDVSDKNQGDGICETLTPTCSLRAAIQESKLDGTNSLITFAVDTVNLDKELPLLDDLDKLIIQGDGTTIDAQGKSRFFTTKESANIEISSVNFQNAAMISNPPEDKVFDDGGSVSFWINPKSDGQNNEGRIMERDTPGGDGWGIIVKSELDGKVKLKFFRKFSTSGGIWETTNREINLNVWNHIVISFDSSSNDNDPKIYINNEIVDLLEVSTPTETVLSDAGNNLYIGNRSNNNRTFDGLIDEVFLIDKILSESEIESIMNNAFSISGLNAAAYWSFDEGSGTTVNDFFNENTGKINNATFVNGKYGKALKFNGESGFVKVEDNETIQNIFDVYKPNPGPKFYTLWGGAINNMGNLTLNDVSIKNGNNIIDTTSWDQTSSSCLCGGVIRNNGKLTIKNSQISSNKSTIKLKEMLYSMQGKGGVICNNANGHVILDNTTISNNEVLIESNNGIAEQFSFLGGAIASYSYFESIDEGESGSVGNNSNTKLEIINGSNIINNEVSFTGDIKKSWIWGGGVYNTGHMTIHDSKVDGNKLNSSITTEHCQCTYVYVHGAGIYSRDSKHVFVDENYDDNYVKVEVQNPYDVSIKNTSISNNGINVDSNVDKAFASGGGMFLSHYHSDSLETLENLEINNNKITGHLENGELLRIGGAALQMGTAFIIKDSTATIKNSTVDGNTLDASGTETDSIYAEGGAIRSAENLILDSTTISNNSAIESGGKSVGGRGGAIYTNQALKILNSTISANSIGDESLAFNAGLFGAAIYGPSEDSNIEIVNSTISNNQAKKALPSPEKLILYGEDSFKGSAISVSGELKIRNSILSNKDGTTQNCNNKDINSDGYNIFDDFSCGELDGTDTDQENVDPLIEELADNGGPTKTHALKAESPAMDRIPLELCTDLNGDQLTLDQRGEARPMPEGGICDIGAYESAIGNPDNIDAPFADKLPENFDITVGFKVNTGYGASKELSHEEDEEEVEIYVELNKPSEEVVTVDYKLVKDFVTAENGEDFIFEEGTLTFEAGETEKTIAVKVLDDQKFEDKKEKMEIYLSNPTNAGLTKDQETFSVYIKDNELGPQDGYVQVTFWSDGGGGFDESNEYGKPGFKNVSVFLSKPSEETVSVKYKVTEDSTATEGEDFEFEEEKELVFEPGEVEKIIHINSIDDLKIEEDETINLELYDAINADLGTDTIYYTKLFETDTEESIAYEKATKVKFWTKGPTPKPEKEYYNINLKVSLSDPSENIVSVKVVVLDSSTATKNEDYTIATDSNIVFQPGETEKYFTLNLINDEKVEGDEIIEFTLISPENAVIGENNTYSIIIKDDDIVEEEPPTEEKPGDESQSGFEYESSTFFDKTNELDIDLDRKSYAEIEDLFKTRMSPEEFLEKLQSILQQNGVTVSRTQWAELEEFILSNDKVET